MGFGKSKKLIAYDDLKEKIINNILQPGDIVNDIELSNELNTSKTPVREALQQLEMEGFIENIHGRGFFVSRIAVQDLKELFDIRIMLECEVAKRAALMVDPEKVNAIKKVFESSRDQTVNSIKEYLKEGDQIHILLFETYGNKRLRELYRKLQEHIIRNRIYLFKEIDDTRCRQSYLEHMEILEALAAKDPLGAETAMKKHLQNSMEYQWKNVLSGP
jgi:GntR family transcriptional regulator, rspAB operon transcriptional repressor